MHVQDRYATHAVDPLGYWFAHRVFIDFRGRAAQHGVDPIDPILKGGGGLKIDAII